MVKLIDAQFVPASREFNIDYDRPVHTYKYDPGAAISQMTLTIGRAIIDAIWAACPSGHTPIMGSLSSHTDPETHIMTWTIQYKNWTGE